MRRFTAGIGVLLIFGHLLLESGALFQKIKDYKQIQVRPILHPPSEGWYDKYGLSLYHWIQLNCIEFLWCLTFFVLAKIAHRYNFRLFLIGCIFFVYHVIDYFMMWWDYKTSTLFYYFLNGAIVLSIIALFIPEKKTGIVKSFD